MANFSNYYRNKVVEHMLRGQVFPVPETVYIALFTANTQLQINDPTAEVDADDYVRKALVLDEADSGGHDPGESANTSDITWDAAENDWGEITHLAIVDHETNEDWGTDVNVLMWDRLEKDGDAAPKTINTDDIFSLPAGNLELDVK